MTIVSVRKWTAFLLPCRGQFGGIHSLFRPCKSVRYLQACACLWPTFSCPPWPVRTPSRTGRIDATEWHGQRNAPKQGCSFLCVALLFRLAKLPVQRCACSQLLARGKYFPVLLSLQVPWLASSNRAAANNLSGANGAGQFDSKN